jgi:hypothetical protein
MELKISMIMMSHLSDAQECSHDIKLQNTHINFVKFLILKHDNINVNVNADDEFKDFSTKHPNMIL